MYSFWTYKLYWNKTECRIFCILCNPGMYLYIICQSQKICRSSCISWNSDPVLQIEKSHEYGKYRPADDKMASFLCISSVIENWEEDGGTWKERCPDLYLNPTRSVCTMHICNQKDSVAYLALEKGQVWSDILTIGGKAHKQNWKQPFFWKSQRTTEVFSFLAHCGEPFLILWLPKLKNEGHFYYKKKTWKSWLAGI